jgi:hypothetical protein
MNAGWEFQVSGLGCLGVKAQILRISFTEDRFVFERRIPKGPDRARVIRPSFQHAQPVRLRPEIYPPEGEGFQGNRSFDGLGKPGTVPGFECYTVNQTSREFLQL